MVGLGPNNRMLKLYILVLYNRLIILAARRVFTIHARPCHHTAADHCMQLHFPLILVLSYVVSCQGKDIICETFLFCPSGSTVGLILFLFGCTHTYILTWTSAICQEIYPWDGFVHAMVESIIQSLS